MKVHEYQAKQLFAEASVKVPAGAPAFSVKEALDVAQKLNSKVFVVKAQIHAGGRGKGGGVKLARSLAEVEQFAKEILGRKLVTHQTGPQGKVVKRLLVEEGCQIEREIYLALTLDRSRSRINLIVCAEGGMEIEEVAAKNPEKILRLEIDPLLGLQDYQLREASKKLQLTNKKVVKNFAKLAKGLAHLYQQYDCTLVEVNPAVITTEAEVIALDGKINIDDNALFRQPKLLELRDLDEEDPRELEASKFDLNYISLSGNIGCLVNGAGLAMATMDIIKLAGGEPANFLDVGGGVSEEAVKEAFKILLSDQQVNGILVNIFGGIVKCDVIASGIVNAAKEIKLNCPLVVRLEGTNVEKGRKILAASQLAVVAAETMSGAAEKIVELVKGN